MSSPADIDPPLEEDLIEAEEIPQEEEMPLPKKSGSSLLFKIIVVSAVLGGGLFYFLSASAPPAPAPAPEVASGDTVSAPADYPVESAGTEIAGDALPDQQSPADVSAPSPEDAAAPVVQDEITAPDPLALEGENAVATAAPETETPAVAMPAPIETPEQNALAQQLQDGEKMPAVAIPSVDSPEVSQTTETPSPSPEPPMAESVQVPSPVAEAAPPAAPEQVSGPSEKEQMLQAKVSELEKEVADLKDTIDQLQKAPVVDKPVKAAPAKKARKAPVARAKTSGLTANSWVLKAAKPGVAWVAKKENGVMRTVAVGETLEGLGRVTAVVKDSSGRWVVNGEKGRISQ